MGRALADLPGAQVGVGAGDVEVTQRGIIERGCGRGVAQHPLGHQLRRAVGVDRQRRVVFVDRHALGLAVDRRGRRKDDVRHAGGDRGGDQRVAGERVVGVIFERLLDRFRHHDRAREMEDRADPLLAEDAVDQPAVGDRAFEERHIAGHDLAGPVRKIVDHRDRPAAVAQREHGVAADIARSAGDEHWNLGHRSVWLAEDAVRRQRYAGAATLGEARQSQLCGRGDWLLATQQEGTITFATILPEPVRAERQHLLRPPGIVGVRPRRHRRLRGRVPPPADVPDGPDDPFPARTACRWATT